MANFCTECGLKVNEEWKFCPKCGTKLPIIESQGNNGEETPTEETPVADEGETKPTDETPTTPVEEEPSDHPKIPRNVDRKTFEGRLKEYRREKAAEEHKSPAYIFENKAIDSLLEARNRILIKQDLYDLKYWAETRIKKYGDDIIDILNQLDQNYIPKKK